MKYLIMFVMLFSASAYAEVNSNYWTINAKGAAIVVEKSSDNKFMIAENDCTYSALSMYDLGTYNVVDKGKTMAVKVRVDKYQLHELTGIVVESSGNAALVFLVNKQLVSEMELGSNIRMLFKNRNGDYSIMETYSLIGFKRTFDAAYTCEKDQYFQDEKSQYFDGV